MVDEVLVMCQILSHISFNLHDDLQGIISKTIRDSKGNKHNRVFPLHQLQRESLTQFLKWYELKFGVPNFRKEFIILCEI